MWHASGAGRRPDGAGVCDLDGLLYTPTRRRVMSVTVPAGGDPGSRSCTRLDLGFSSLSADDDPCRPAGNVRGVDAR